MKTFNWKNFILGCVVGLVIVMAKHYYDNKTITVDYPLAPEVESLEVEEIAY